MLKTLLKTNRPPTDEERAIVQKSMVPINAKLKGVEEKISETVAYIEALKARVQRAEIKLQRFAPEGSGDLGKLQGST